MAEGTKRPTSPDLPKVHVTSRAEWRAWLHENHAESAGIWLVHFKKSSGKATDLDYEAIVREALCYGWIDSTAGTFDEERTMLRMTPRKPGSVWSRPNKVRVDALLDDGLMMPVGMEKIHAAKRDGSWDALNDVDAMVMPADLEAALAANPAARANFDAFPPSARKVILFWIGSAKKEETRARRIAQTVSKAAENVRAYP